MSRSLQKVGNYPTLHSRASRALRVCRLRFTVQQCSGGLMIRNPSARPIPEGVDPQEWQQFTLPLSFISSRTPGPSMFPSTSTTPDFAYGPGPRVSEHFCSSVAL